MDTFVKKISLVVLVALAAGCASGPNDYSRSEARVVQTVAYGTVESVRAVRITEDKPIVGTVTGAVGTIAVVQPGMQSFSIGERVRVLTGPKGTRVEQG